jgi:hypothetical protein
MGSFSASVDHVVSKSCASSPDPEGTQGSFVFIHEQKKTREFAGYPVARSDELI